MKHPDISSVNVLGLGKSGVSAAKLADRLGLRISAFDEKEPADMQALSKEISPDRLQLFPKWIGDKLPSCSLNVVSPGISKDSALWKAAVNSGAEIVSELEFAYRFLEAPIIAITGTNGKTTTTEMLSFLLGKEGMRAPSAGNIGVPLSDFASSCEKYDIIVVEVSSFQLENCTSFAPVSAALLNITSDHMNRYSDFDDYAATKFRVFNGIRPKENMVIRKDLLPLWKKFLPASPGPMTFSGTEHDADFHVGNDSRLCIEKNGRPCSFMNMSECALKGVHNAENILAATSMVLSVIPDADPLKIGKNVCEFRTGPHRMELVAEFNKVKYINDSKATNPDSVVAALNSIAGTGNVCLIMGGLDKNMDFSTLLQHSGKIKSIFLLGESKKKLANLFEGYIYYKMYDDFEDAVIAASSATEPGDVVLLSPGCASMDMFQDYRERGNKFIEIVNGRIRK